MTKNVSVGFSKKRIGVLALQGAFHLHQRHIEGAGAVYVEVISPIDLEKIDGLILPGGESGVMLKLMSFANLTSALAKFLEFKPAWGICAGAILLAKIVTNPPQFSFGCIELEIERNAYGRQLESTEEIVNTYGVSFIRAPRITTVGPNVEILFRKSEDPCWVEQKNIMVTTFHPETNMDAPSPWHQRFITSCSKI